MLFEWRGSVDLSSFPSSLTILKDLGASSSGVQTALAPPGMNESYDNAVDSPRLGESGPVPDDVDGLLGDRHFVGELHRSGELNC